MSIKVLLAEDSAYQRKIIAEMITSNKEIEVVDVARNGREAIQKIGEHFQTFCLNLYSDYLEKNGATMKILKTIMRNTKYLDGI